MSNLDIVRAWKDAEYRQRLSAEEQALVPEYPAGSIEMTDEELSHASGRGPLTFEVAACFETCPSFCIVCYTSLCTAPLTQ